MPHFLHTQHIANVEANLLINYTKKLLAFLVFKSYNGFYNKYANTSAYM